MVPIVLFWSLATSVALVAGIGIGVVISKKVGYNKARKAYYRRMEKKGRKERSALMSSTRSKSLSQNQIKKCVKHSITPRYKLGNHRLKTVNNYFTKRQTKQERKYSQIMGKLDLIKVNKEIAEKTGNLNASRKYERKIRKLQGLKSNLETKNLSLSDDPERKNLDWVAKTKIKELGVEFEDPTTYIRCFDEKTASEYRDFHYANIKYRKKVANHGNPYVADLAFSKNSGVESLMVGALHKTTFEKGIELLAERAVDIYSSLPDSEKDKIFPITVRRMVNVNNEFENISLGEKLKNSIKTGGLGVVSRQINNIAELNSFLERSSARSKDCIEKM